MPAVSRATIDDYMTRDPVTFAPDLEVTHAVADLVRRNISGAPVIDDAGALVGMFTAKDSFSAVMHAAYHREMGGRVADFMTAPVETLEAGTGLMAAARRFRESPFRRFPVVRDGALVGVL